MSFFDISGLERKVRAILAIHDGLSMHGFAVVGEGMMPILDIAQQREIEREALLSLDSLRAIAFAEGWITSRLQRDNERINRRHTSMALKHLAEGETGYLANGQFIVAVLLQGFALARNGSDVFFNVAEDSVQRAVRNQRLSAYLGEMKMNKRVIKQVAPATGWVASCWVEEQQQWVEAPLVGWAVVDGDVVGLIENNLDDRLAEGEPSMLFADELSNFRYYRYKENA